MKFNLKSQVFYTDFMIAILIFFVILGIYFTYTTNLSSQDTLFDELLTDAKTISSMLLSEGYPSNWTNESVVRLGLTNNNQIINETLLLESSKINYNKTRRLLGAKHDFFVYFQNESNNVTTYGDDSYGLGSDKVTYTIKMAYYGHQSPADDLMEPYMREIGADIYWGWEELEELLEVIDDYKFILIEDCHCDDLQKKHGGSDALGKIAEWVSDGGLLFASEHHNNTWKEVSGHGNTKISKIMGVYAWKGDKVGGGTEATVKLTDSLLNLNVNEQIIFEEDAIVLEDSPENNDAIDFTMIVNWSDDHSKADKYRSNASIAKWRYGKGEVYYFPDFHANYLGNRFVEVMEAAVQTIKKKESYLKITEEYDGLVKLERLAILNSSIVKMVVYVWE